MSHRPSPSLHAPLLTELLGQVSRSFYLTLRVLPRPIRPQIGLAYLLARTTDTIADTSLIPVDQRLGALRRLRERILQKHQHPLDLHTLAKVNDQNLTAEQGSSAERQLLLRVEEALSLLESFDAQDQKLIRHLLAIITEGQILDLQRFGHLRRGQVKALETDADLDDYTYRVAGCVGEFWTHLCREHILREPRYSQNAFLEQGVRFGKGLQLINILRDLPRDLRQGRCYLPQNELGPLGLEPADLLAPDNEPILAPLYHAYLQKAEEHLRQGWDYTCSLPWHQFRLRLACAWPILIGARTFSRLRTGPFLHPDRRIKVERPEIKRLLLRSAMLLPFSRAWHAQFSRALR